MVQAVGTFGFALVLSLIFEWRVGLVALTFVPIIIFVLYKEGRMTYAATSGTVKVMETSSKVNTKMLFYRLWKTRKELLFLKYVELCPAALKNNSQIMFNVNV